MSELQITKAERKDVLDVYKCIIGIAEYEKMLDQVETTPALLEQSLFDFKQAEVLLARIEGSLVGFALYFYNFSTFKGRKGLYLEDLFIFPEFRKKGYGKQLFLKLIQIANQENCGRMEWVCLNWNQPAIDFYLSLGAKPLEDWTIYRLDEKTLSNFEQNSRLNR